MALNPHLFPNGMPVPFLNEIFVLIRGGVEFEVDKISGANGDRVKAKGTIYLSNVRIVFVPSKPMGNFNGFDMPLGFKINVFYPRDSSTQALANLNGKVKFLLYLRDEKFNQPIFFCNNISGVVEPVVPENEHRALYGSHLFKILFKEGGCGTFVPLLFNLLSSVRHHNRQFNPGPEPRVDPLRATQTPVDEMMRTAYVDPNDPTRIYLQQPTAGSQLRRRTYQSQPSEF